MFTMHNDYFKQELKEGDTVIYAPGGAYAGVSIGIIEKFTPKQVGIRPLANGRGRHMGNRMTDKLYYTYSNQIVKYDNRDIR